METTMIYMIYGLVLGHIVTNTQKEIDPANQAKIEEILHRIPNFIKLHLREIIVVMAILALIGSIVRGIKLILETQR